jgi:hypothetical protein
MESDAGTSGGPKPRFRVQVETLVVSACVATLVALALMSWSVLDPTPLPVMVSMSIGQAIGTLALACYLGAVLLYQLRLRSERRGSKPPES